MGLHKLHLAWDDDLDQQSCSLRVTASVDDMAYVIFTQGRAASGRSSGDLGNLNFYTEKTLESDERTYLERARMLKL